ncbi:RlpA-like double-psi beta-barrel-protein domain-containing protein-containing protein [Xylariaceae sp. FL0255]|nr:RlpA-like double-psi beta-barrel-protein domain-containing protein-containing protein [Xylariaceae sp. FL0255]
MLSNILLPLLGLAASTTAIPTAATRRAITLAPSPIIPRQAAINTTYTGDLTYYADGLGACGVTNSESDAIVALSEILFDQYTPNGNPNNNLLCGLQIQIYGNDSTSVVVTVEDRCTACAEYDVDVPEAVFSQIADPNLGRVVVSWDWLDDVPAPINSKKL